MCRGALLWEFTGTVDRGKHLHDEPHIVRRERELNGVRAQVAFQVEPDSTRRSC